MFSVTSNFVQKYVLGLYVQNHTSKMLFSVFLLLNSYLEDSDYFLLLVLIRKKIDKVQKNHRFSPLIAYLDFLGYCNP